MGYQLRHKDNGLYQGSFLGMGFWHPISGMPEQGICKFNTKEDAQEYLDLLVSPQMKREDLTIEDFDTELDARLVKSYKKDKEN